MTAPKLATRKPTGIVPWPFILIEGGEKSGKSWAIAELSASDKVGTVYWIDLGEGSADEYGAIPGADYQVIVHDGSWQSILGQVDAVTAEAQRVADAGDPPVVLAIDSMTAVWDLLKQWADGRARKRKNKGPNDDVVISMDLWNDAGGRHGALVTRLHRFPGIVVATARGKEVAALDASGKPVEGQKTYKVEGHKNLAYDASAWVRFCRETPPQIIGCRSVRYGVRPGVDKPKPTSAAFTLEGLIFNVLGCDPGTAKVRDMPALHGGEPTEAEEPRGQESQRKAPTAPAAAPKAPAATRTADQPANGLLTAEKLDGQKGANWWAEKVAENGDGELDAAGCLSEDDRLTLGIGEDDTVTLDDLCAFVTSYWAKHGHGPRQDEPVAAAG